MGGSIHTRIAAVVLALVLLSIAASCFAIASSARDALEAASRVRLKELASYLRDVVAESGRPGPSPYGGMNLQMLLEAAVVRDQDLRLVAVVGRDGEIIASADRGDGATPGGGRMLTAGPAPEQPEILYTGADLVVRVGLSPDHGGPAGQILLAVPRDRLAPQVERLIASMLGGALALIAGLVPLTFGGVYLILRPLSRSIRIVDAALQALGRGRAPPIPSREQALDGRGDPCWDAPEPAEVESAYLQMVDAFARARGSYVAAGERLQRLERRIALYDTVGADALDDGPERAPPGSRDAAGSRPRP